MTGSSRSTETLTDRVIMGRVAGLYGVRGWVKVISHTRSHVDIFDYARWYLQVAGSWRAYTLAEGRPHGRGLIARLEGCNDRDAASDLVGADIAVDRAELPRLAPGSYYWAQLQGMQVFNTAGEHLGSLSHLFDTGANDVMVVVGERERLIPYIRDVVKHVDLSTNKIIVEWDADF